MLFDNWKENLQPIIDKYKDNKHPLAYENLYQLLIMIILAAKDSDVNINAISISFFQKYPNIVSLSKATPSEINNYISTVENYKNKSNWLSESANLIQSEDKIPTNLDDLIKLKGVGIKSANVILREINKEPKGIIVDLHVLRVVPRVGLTPKLTDGIKIEKLLM